MFLIIPFDIIQHIIDYLNNIYHVINFTIINKYFYNNINDNFYFYWAINRYTKEFWIKASNRDKHISKPLNSMKNELLRIQNFTDIMADKNLNWTIKDFYDLWDSLEKNKNKKNKNNKNYLYSSLYGNYFR
tara:strand:+ start:146 stop:538 length:393 start_codon:yes stop_codon:yes gene_type:complete